MKVVERVLELIQRIIQKNQFGIIQRIGFGNL